ncbi:hypothetical protein LTR78_001826 [Recurvomyces mirabilis]|uniref:Uncharacterized protein n=1 Tax=Recurvomyces mirabilis TaxID=574656 RepID=A0AAE1C568_9PEZI|nr:hypothetical protein LTR78_001826 [Recurvomyces mirabilis]KAK5156734.1 hypothetical protein LTS14_004946 [Recurvomyces mirabilis]
MATTTTSPAANWSYHSIPYAFALGLAPHLYYTSRMMVASKGKMSMADPRTNLQAWKGKMPEILWHHLSRARGAHLNSMEIFPLYAAAVVSALHLMLKAGADSKVKLAGNAAGLPAQDLNTMAYSFLGARTLYCALYMTVTNDIAAFARTGVYAWSIGIPLVALWKAGNQTVI